MFMKQPLLLLLALSPVLAGASAHGPGTIPVPPASVAQVSAAPTAAGVPAIVLPTGPRTLGERFAQPDETVEYHFMIGVAALSEAELPSAFQAGVVDPLKAVADVGVLGKCALAAYVDTRGRALEERHLIVRVREGSITVKARAAAPADLPDLEACVSRKYEIDRFGAAEYSISSEIRCGADEVDIRSPALTPAAVWAAIEEKCPGVWKQLRPVIRSARELEIPGVAHMYSAPVTLKHPVGARAREASVAVWFFPPTEKFLVELAFTGYVKDRADMERMHGELEARLRTAGLLRTDQTSKTQQYFAAYFASTPGRPRSGTRRATTSH
jgi:hypothetical protein